MTQFEREIEEMVERRARERTKFWNETLLAGLQERTHDETLKELLETLTFVGGVSDLLPAQTADSHAYRDREFAF